jgi:maleate isomerase
MLAMSSPSRVLVGVLTPSSNTRLEPLTARLTAGLPEVSAHFSRFRVVDVGLAAADQFGIAKILDAADLLADAQVAAIVWSGTSGAWTGLDSDRELCAAITARTGIPATTSTLALMDAAQRGGHGTLGLVTPYPDDMHATVAATLTAAGLPVISARNHAVTTSNWELSTIGTDVLTRLVAEVAANGPAMITTFCTNLAAADQVAGWERDFGVPVYDTVALAVWRVLELAGVDAARVTGWGSLFALG